MLENVKKRNDDVVPFDLNKIKNVIFLSLKSVNIDDESLANTLANKTKEYLMQSFPDDYPSVEDISDIVEEVLMNSNNHKAAKSFILYRQKRSQIRESKNQIIGKKIDTNLTINALEVLKTRYLLKDDDRNVVESPSDLFRRVAKTVASAELVFNKDLNDATLKNLEDEFYNIMNSLDFLPNSPTLMNAGTDMQQLSACFVLPIEDNMESIFGTLKDAAIIHKSGGGTGFSFSRLRPKNDYVRSTQGVSSGPISFMKVYDSEANVVKQGGKRRGANMGILRVDHPDILEFISAKEQTSDLTNFNISVAITDKFMNAVQEDTDYELINPKNKKCYSKLRAKEVFNLICTQAWRTGEPGIVFIDKINENNPTPEIAEIESTNPCGEQPLLPYESCNLGSINLAHFVVGNDIDFDRLRKVVHLAINFLDNIIEINDFPLDKIKEMTQSNRKIGLGVMGFADMLFQLKIAYNSDEAVQLAEKVMKFIDDEALEESKKLAELRGPFPNFDKSIYKNLFKVRNATRTTIAPTGSISMIADTSSGIEPLFSISFIKRVLDERELLYVNKYFKKIMKDNNIYSDDLMKKISNLSTIKNVDEIPEELRKVFVVAHDITPKWHVKIQAAFQKYCNNAVSKTVNFSNSASVADVTKVYLLAYESGCKGTTIYRDGSREGQVLNLKSEKKEEQPSNTVDVEDNFETEDKDLCPVCEGKLYFSEGCANCPKCGFSKCSI